MHLLCLIPYDQFHVKISRQYYPIVLLVTNMGELCGTEGGWTRLAYLDMYQEE